MKQSVLMFHIGRSGSRVVGKLLDQHENIDWQGEVLKSASVSAFADSLPVRTDYDPFDHLATLSDRRTADWLGLEIKYYHLRQCELGLGEVIDRVEAAGCDRFITLKRENFLRKIVSSVVASDTRQYHRGSGERPELNQVTLRPEFVKIDADAKPLLEFLDDYHERWERIAEILDGKRVLSLTYEKDVYPGPKIAYRKICEFLSLEPGDPEVPFGKTNPFPLTDLIRNFEEVHDHLAGTRYGWMTEV